MAANLSTDHPPTDANTLAAWFAEGVRAELVALEKDGGSQNYEVLAGKLIEKRSQTQAIFQFIIADGIRISEEATGRLKTASDEYAVTVIGQQADRIDLCVKGTAPLSPGIHRAMLIIDDTALLRKLALVLDETAQKPTLVSPLAIVAFHPAKANVGFATLQATSTLVKFNGQPRRVAEQACGSTLTYIWGPPGTGKTYTIAHLVTALVEAGERVLVSSHTRAAVDQALYEAVKCEKDKEGPLAGHSAVHDGKVLRIGMTADKKIPPSVRLDAVVETKGRKLVDTILDLERKAKPLADRRSQCLAVISEWDRLSELSNRLQEVRVLIELQEAKRKEAEVAITSCKFLLQQRRAELERAQRAWFRRAAKTARALQALQDSEAQLQRAEMALGLSAQEIAKAQRLTSEIEVALIHQQTVCAKCPARQMIEQELSQLALELETLEQKIRALQDEISQLEQKVITEARAIFCTLTKSYVGKQLEGQSFDAVIVDEISMALPPLIFLAAGRATRRVILVGDFLQLPPIVRGDTPLGNARLGTDTYHLAGVAKDLKPNPDYRHVLPQLRTQRRMRTEIADVARHLVYTAVGGLDDSPERPKGKSPDWLEFLPENPLIIVDTADLHCWSGKQPGSLSRFNFCSATVAVEIAAMAAAKLQKPPDGSPQPIGIVTPFAAQRRLLTKLIADLDLHDWVAAGTVHTFQGGEADLIIFDSVLDEPYYAARLCNPRDACDVKRDLNVAVTRAKNKFIFIGSSEWLNKHAKPVSGLGQMWQFLTNQADLISALELVKLERFRRVFDQYIPETGWNVPRGDTGYTFEHLDETSFFERFTKDLNAASDTIFGLAPYFGEYRWPRIQPIIRAALARGVKVTLVTPPLSEAENRSYVEKVIKNLRELGAVVVSASGVHGKDVIIDEQVIYTGSMNWSSNRGRSEEVHRIHAPQYAKLCLQLMQAKHIRQAAIHEDGTPRICPLQDCGWPVQVVNQRQQHGTWDFQAMKVGCTNPDCEGYLRNIDERPPFKSAPVCKVDGRTKYRHVRRGRGEVWQCPKHPRDCPGEKVVPGDPA
ncbi:MAG: AAA domain-containing protein [Chlamydiota bacterium]